MPQVFDDNWKVQYRDNITTLAGELRESAAYKYMEKESKRGEIVFLDSMVEDQEATSTSLENAEYYRKNYDQIGSPTLGDWTNIKTPHMEVKRERTMLTPFHNEYGYTFRSIDEVAENRMEKSRVIQFAMNRMMKRREIVIMDALFQDSVMRGKDQSVVSAVALPGSQKITEASGLLDKDVINEVKQKYEDNYIGAVGEDEPIFMFISPEQKKNLIEQSGDVLHNKDFISSSGHFEGATIPNVYGVHLIVHPLLARGRGYEVDGDGGGTWSGGRAVAFTPKWGCFNQFDGLSSDLDKDPGERFQYKLYCDEMINAARVDDKRIVHLRFGTQA